MIKGFTNAIELAKDRLKRAENIQALTIVEVGDNLFIVITDLYILELSVQYERFNIIMRIDRGDI